MITLTHSVSGSEVGRELINDAEELAYALIEMSDQSALNIGPQVADVLYGDDRKKVVEWLKSLAREIEPGVEE